MTNTYRTQLSVVRIHKTCSTFLLQSRFCLAAACYTIYVFLLDSTNIYILYNMYFVKCSILFYIPSYKKSHDKTELIWRMVFMCNIIAKLSLLYYKKVYERKFMCLSVGRSFSQISFLYFTF